MRFFAVSVRFFLYFRIRQPVAVAVRPKIVKNRTGPDLKTLLVPGLVGSNAAFLVPDNVHRKFMEGWSSHVSLVHLTDKGCLFKNKSSTNDAITFNPVTGTIHTTSASLSDDRELDLTFDE